jgi:hypothetical protein
MRMRRARPGLARCRAGLLATVVAQFFFDVHLVLREDGSGKLRAQYTATPITSEATERFRFSAPSTRLTGMGVADGVATVRLSFDDVRTLSDAPEFKESPVDFGPSLNGVRKVTARVRSALVPSIDQGRVTLESDERATVRLTVPGTIVATNGEVTSRRTAAWSAPIRRFFHPEGIDVQATYRVRAPARADGTATARADRP